MTLADYVDLQNFTAQEVMDTGGNPETMERGQMVGMQNLRSMIGRRIVLLHGGMNSGEHTAAEHPEGRASDFILDPKDGPINQAVIYKVFTSAIACGFKGIGVYFNGVCWSFHVDSGQDVAFWIGRKSTPNAEGWTYRRMQIGSPAA